MQWKSQDFIFKPDQTIDWMQSHAQAPVADYLGNDIYRVYFASRDARNYSHIGYFEFNVNHPNRILDYSKAPVLTPGDIGFFDEHGVFPSSMINFNKKKYLYYIGWNKGSEQPLFYASIGLAISDDGGKTFKKYSKAPILSRSEHDPCLVTAPFVFDENSSELKMLYVSGFRWERDSKYGLKSFYHLKFAHSQDGIHWKREGIVAIDFHSELETNLSKASIIKQNETYRAFFSYCTKTDPYRLGYAESKDGRLWDRKWVANTKFHHHTICYPCAIPHKNRIILLYNGEKFGAEGISMLVLNQDFNEVA